MHESRRHKQSYFTYFIQSWNKQMRTLEDFKIVAKAVYNLFVLILAHLSAKSEWWAIVIALSVDVCCRRFFQIKTSLKPLSQFHSNIKGIILEWSSIRNQQMMLQGSKLTMLTCFTLYTERFFVKSARRCL